MNDEDFIRRTFELASKGLGSTWPNPLVGAVISKDGKIIGEGHHAQYGLDHAEVSALKNCTESPAGATLYVNLEPCCHTNKQTPPCAQRLIKEGIKKVVICNLDPNPFVNGGGIELLRANGVEVVHGILDREGKELNEVFFHLQNHQRPFVRLKMATTLDGKIALPSGESQWITGDKAREHVHLLRSQSQVIMVGAETVRKDDPKLTVRLSGYTGPQPYRVVISKSKQLPSQCQLLTDEFKDKTLIYSSIDEAMEDLFKRRLVTIFLEGGPKLASSFMAKGFIDRVDLYLNPSFIGKGPSILENLEVNSLSSRPKLRDVKSTLFGEDLYLTGRM